jgi:hypothetical protein
MSQAVRLACGAKLGNRGAEFVVHMAQLALLRAARAGISFAYFGSSTAPHGDSHETAAGQQSRQGLDQAVGEPTEPFRQQ